MNYFLESHRNALLLLEESDAYRDDWESFKAVLDNITDEKLINYFNTHSYGKNKSLSVAINRLLKDELVNKGWRAESPIFQDSKYVNEETWRLDFTKNKIAVEVAFNHGEATSWNLIKPCLSSELNHVEKAIQTEIGILITATNELKKSCGFDSAVGTYEKFLTYLNPLRQMLTVPILIIGLDKPKTFKIGVRKDELGKNKGSIEML